MNFIELINEARTGGGRGSKAGRTRYTSGAGAKGTASSDSTEAQKSKAKVYNSIDDALKHSDYGQIFSTHGSKRLYVVTKHKWGKSGQQTVGGKTAKGFTPGTIPASFKDVKKYAQRTVARHGKQRNKQLQSKQVWSKPRKIA